MVLKYNFHTSIRVKSCTLWMSQCQSSCHNPNRKTKNSNPTSTIRRAILPSMIWLPGFLGLSVITLWSGGSDDKAIAAKVSIIKFTHNICVTLSGESSPMNAPNKTMRQAHTLMVIWNKMNLLMFK